MVLAVLAMLLAGVAHGVEIDGLYDAEVKVRGQGESERERGFEAALRRVIVRVSGNSEAPQNPDLEELLAAPERYVQSFRYRGIDDPDTDAADDDEQAPTDYLAVSFNGSRLERDLQARDIVTWGRRRPEVLLWVGVDEGRDRYIVGESDGGEARTALRERAGERGLPLLLPLLDVEDDERIDFIDIRAPFVEAISHASERYRADTILLGHVSQRGDEEWIGEWTLLDDDSEIRWRVRGDARDAMLAAGIDGATDRIAAREVGREGGPVEVRIEVAAVDSLADYTRVADYLGSLARVNAADIQRVRGDRAGFRVQLQGRPEELQRAIAAGNVLDPMDAPAVSREIEPAESEAELDDLVDDLLAADADADETDADGESSAPIELYYRLAG